MAEVCPDCGASLETPVARLIPMKSAPPGGDAAASLKRNRLAREPGKVCGFGGESFSSEEKLGPHNRTRPPRRKRANRTHAVPNTA